MEDIQLRDGRTVTGDLHRITIAQYRRILDKAQPQAEEDEYIGKVFDLTGEEVGNLSLPDYRLLTKSFFALIMNPLGEGDEKNSESAPT
jgi:hypothetical protein